MDNQHNFEELGREMAYAIEAMQDAARTVDHYRQQISREISRQISLAYPTDTTPTKISIYMTWDIVKILGMTTKPTLPPSFFRALEQIQADTAEALNTIQNIQLPAFEPHTLSPPDTAHRAEPEAEYEGLSDSHEGCHSEIERLLHENHKLRVENFWLRYEAGDEYDWETDSRLYPFSDN